MMVMKVVESVATEHVDNITLLQNLCNLDYANYH